MKGKLVNEYSKANKNGNMQTNYVYKVTGTPEELAKFNQTESAKSVAKADGDNGVKAGDNLWFTSRYEGENVDLVVTKSNRVAVDTSADRKILSLASRYGKAGDRIIADHIAAKMRKSGGSETPATVAANTEDLSLDKLS